MGRSFLAKGHIQGKKAEVLILFSGLVRGDSIPDESLFAKRR
jgi:hypothetical protein